MRFVLRRARVGASESMNAAGMSFDQRRKKAVAPAAAGCERTSRNGKSEMCGASVPAATGSSHGVLAYPEGSVVVD